MTKYVGKMFALKFQATAEKTAKKSYGVTCRTLYIATYVILPIYIISALHYAYGILQLHYEAGCLFDGMRGVKQRQEKRS